MTDLKTHFNSFEAARLGLEQETIL